MVIVSMITFESLVQDNYSSLGTFLPKNVILFPLWNSLDDLMYLLEMLDCDDEVIKTFIADRELWAYLENLPSILE